MKISLSELSEVKGIGKKTISRIREKLMDDKGYESKYNPDKHIPPNTVVKGDCLEKMNGIPDDSVDMIACDPHTKLRLTTHGILSSI